MIVLGIETSCDETGVAIYDTAPWENHAPAHQGILGQALHSQIAMHRDYGGVVPELASRDHIRRVLPLLDDALHESGLKLKDIDAVAYYKNLYSKMDLLEMDRKFTARAVNEGFSGGEKKRNEILQMMMLEPEYCILDETDSGLDIDALKIVAKGVNAMRSPDRGFLLITHYQRLLDYIKPDHVHVMAEGRIVRSGGPELAHELEKDGYEFLKEPALA